MAWTFAGFFRRGGVTRATFKALAQVHKHVELSGEQHA